MLVFSELKEKFIEKNEDITDENGSVISITNDDYTKYRLKIINKNIKEHEKKQKNKFDELKEEIKNLDSEIAKNRKSNENYQYSSNDELEKRISELKDEISVLDKDLVSIKARYEKHDEDIFIRHTHGKRTLENQRTDIVELNNKMRIMNGFILETRSFIAETKRNALNEDIKKLTEYKNNNIIRSIEIEAQVPPFAVLSEDISGFEQDQEANSPLGTASSSDNIQVGNGESVCRALFCNSYSIY